MMTRCTAHVWADGGAKSWGRWGALPVIDDQVLTTSSTLEPLTQMLQMAHGNHMTTPPPLPGDAKRSGPNTDDDRADRLRCIHGCLLSEEQPGCPVVQWRRSRFSIAASSQLLRASSEAKAARRRGRKASSPGWMTSSLPHPARWLECSLKWLFSLQWRRFG